MTIYAPLGSRPQYGQPIARRVEIIQEVRQMMLILGVPIDNLTMADALDRIEGFVRKGRHTNTTHHIVSVNTEILVRSLDDAPLRALLQSAAMCTASDRLLRWGSRLLGMPLRDPVTVANMVPRLAERAAASQLSLYLLGNDAHRVQQVRYKLETAYPSLNIVGAASTKWRSGNIFERALLHDMRATRPDILLIALERHDQAAWLTRYAAAVSIPVVIGLDGAPRWPVALLWQFSADVMRFAPCLLRQWWLLRTLRPEQPLTVEARVIGETSILNLHGALTYHSSSRLLQHAMRALSRRPFVTINLADVTTLDCVALGMLMQLKLSAENDGGHLRLVGISKRLKHTLDSLHLSSFFNVSRANLMLGYRS